MGNVHIMGHHYNNMGKHGAKNWQKHLCSSVLCQIMMFRDVFFRFFLLVKKTDEHHD